tara:strand:+ start:838 stop:1218 length:381 start_codon:yes stop_codon:yes gene_type:complete
MSSYFTRALEALKPNSEWAVTGDQYSRLTWLDKTQTKPTEEEVITKVAELRAEEPMRLLREERNRRLSECDWIVTKNAEYGHNISIPWRNYRQALRDLPNLTYAPPELDEFGNLKMDSVAWPTPPE